VAEEKHDDVGSDLCAGSESGETMLFLAVGADEKQDGVGEKRDAGGEPGETVLFLAVGADEKQDDVGDRRDAGSEPGETLLSLAVGAEGKQDDAGGGSDAEDTREGRPEERTTRRRLRQRLSASITGVGKVEQHPRETTLRHFLVPAVSCVASITRGAVRSAKTTSTSKDLSQNGYGLILILILI